MLKNVKRRISFDKRQGINGFYLVIFILLFIIAGLVGYLFIFSKKNNPFSYSYVEIGRTTPDKFNDPYSPPLKNDGGFFTKDSSDFIHIPSSSVGSRTIETTNNIEFKDKIEEIKESKEMNPNRAINIQTQRNVSEFSQIGILSKESVIPELGGEPKILPLMGRRIINGRNKYQYYTISNSGNVNTKLPIRKEGRNCITEYGCDELYTGDIVFVEGYNDKFKVTVYENELFRYIP